MKMTTWRVLPACLGALLLTSTTAAAADLLEVRSMPMKVPAQVKDLPAWSSTWADGGISMPYVVGQPSVVASRMNQALFFGQMGMPAPAQFGPVFSPLPEQLPEGVASQEFELTRHDDRVVSIKFTVEGCGAYCEGYDLFYNFDARNGYLLDLRDLLTPAGRAAAAKRVVEDRKRQYTDMIKSKKRELAEARKQGQPPEGLRDIEDRIPFNEECLEHEKRPDRATDLLDYAKFRLEGNTIVVWTERCSNHALRALDDVADVETTLAPKDLANGLTVYGKTMVLGQGDAPPPATPFGQVLRGKIAGVPVTLRLDRLHGSGTLSGSYVYDKYARMISLRGNVTGNSVELIEGTSEDDKATLTLTQRGTALTGQWQGKGKTAPVALDW